MRRRWLLLLIALLSSSLRARAEEAPALQNADFAIWSATMSGGGFPASWEVLEGARMGDGPASRLARGTDGGLRLEGGATTRVWQMVSQRATPPADATCRLSFEARLLGSRLDPGQRDNAYVGVPLVRGTSRKY